MATVALIGATCWGNRGAEAMLTTSIGIIRERHPDARFHVFSYYPEQDRRLIGDPSVAVFDARPLALVLQHLPFALVSRWLRSVGLRCPDTLMPRAIRALGASDVLLDLGGISFADGRDIYLPFNILCVYPAVLLGVPVVKLAQAMGPFRDWRNRTAAAIFLRRCHHLVARGKRTLGHLEELGLPGHQYSLAADVAFGYRPAFSLSHENEGRVAAMVQRLSRADARAVGLSPSSVMRAVFEKGGRDYVGCLAEIAENLVNRGCHVVVLPNATRETSTKRKNNDLVVIAELRRRIQNTWSANALAQTTWVDFDVNTDGIRRVIACLTVLVTSRFHAMIAALCTHTPVLVVGWSHKYVEVLETFGLERYVADDTTASSRLSELLDELLNRSSSVRQQIVEALPAVHASALRQFDIVEALLA